MLQLKHLKLLCDLTGAKPSEIKALKFGDDPASYFSALTVGLAFQTVPSNRIMVVLRSQVYMFNNDSTATDYCFYRTLPAGKCYWSLLDPSSATIIDKNYTSTTAARQLAADVDEFLFFPPNYTAGLYFKPAAAPPASGSWLISATIFAYLVSPEISDKLQGSQSWIANT